MNEITFLRRVGHGDFKKGERNYQKSKVRAPQDSSQSASGPVDGPSGVRNELIEHTTKLLLDSHGQSQ